MAYSRPLVEEIEDKLDDDIAVRVKVKFEKIPATYSIDEIIIYFEDAGAINIVNKIILKLTSPSDFHRSKKWNLV